ncbi:MAG: hypothetical protein AAF610_07305 [Pseudomonadota bacterium]
MPAPYPLILIAHVVAGAVALVVFWIPMAARKGSALHLRAGRWFMHTMLTVAGTGIALSALLLVDPVGSKFPDEVLSMARGFDVARQARRLGLFLMMLSVLVIATARHATLVLEGKSDRAPLRTPGHLFWQVSTGLLGMATGVVGIGQRDPLLIIFAVLSINGSIRMLRYSYKRTLAPREWLLEHISFATGCGIAAYTAFAAFGGRAVFSELLPGQWQLLPWILPTVIGTAYARRASARYTAKKQPNRPKLLARLGIKVRELGQTRNLAVEKGADV